MARAGLTSAEFLAAFARYGRTLWVIGAAWVGRSEAADVVQETARIAWERRTDWRPGSEVRAWLAQIARHVGANWRRQSRRRPAPTADGALGELTGSRPTLPLAATAALDPDQLGLSDEVARGLAQLTEIARACLLLHVVLGHPFAAIATLLDIPENTAASHVRRARLALRAALTAAPTAAPTTAPTTAPTAAPTTAPTAGATTAPTKASTGGRST